MIFYRLKDSIELFNLGIEDALYENAVMLIEWPERFDCKNIFRNNKIYNYKIYNLGGEKRIIATDNKNL